MKLSEIKRQVISDTDLDEAIAKLAKKYHLQVRNKYSATYEFTGKLKDLRAFYRFHENGDDSPDPDTDTDFDNNFIEDSGSMDTMVDADESPEIKARLDRLKSKEREKDAEKSARIVFEVEWKRFLMKDNLKFTANDTDD